MTEPKCTFRAKVPAVAPTSERESFSLVQILLPLVRDASANLPSHGQISFAAYFRDGRIVRTAVSREETALL